ncbi:MAG: hypothetical protein AAGE52_20890 [Myxococcota bacterium]
MSAFLRWSCVALALVSSGSAFAQSRWVVVSAGVGARDGDEAVERVEQALDAQGEEVLPATSASAEIEAQSAPYRSAPEDLVERLGVATEAVLTSVARGEDQAAIDRALPVLESIEGHLASLGRDERTAADVGNLCYFVVRAFLQKQDVGAARQQLDICRRLAPSFELSRRLHPPSVHELLAERGSEGTSVVAVQLLGGNEACAVRLQGRRVGMGRRVRMSVPPGRYVVQAECEDRPGRVHEVRVLGDRPARLDLDVRFEQALRTGAVLALEYESARRLDLDLPSHLSRLGELLGVNRILVRVAGEWRAFRVDDGGVRPLVTAFSANAQTAADAQQVALTALGRVDEVPVEEAPTRLWVAGMLVSIVGLALNAVGWKFKRDLDDAYDALDGGSVSLRVSLVTDVDESYNRGIGFAASGAVALLVGVPMMLPRRRGTPWWTWVMGAAGVGFGVWGATRLAQTRECLALEDRAVCERQSRHEVEATLILSYAVPLILTPFIYLVRNDGGSGGITASVGRGRAQLGYHTTF